MLTSVQTDCDHTLNTGTDPKNSFHSCIPHSFFCSVAPGKTEEKLKWHLCAPFVCVSTSPSQCSPSFWSFHLSLSAPNKNALCISFLSSTTGRFFQCCSSLCSWSLLFLTVPTQGQRATWLTEYCFSLTWSTLHKSHMSCFSKPTSQLDKKTQFWIM